MYLVASLLLAFAGGFWDTKPPEDWTVQEVQEILESSPWSRTLRGRGNPLLAHLASALPMQQAEKRQRAFQKRTGAPDASFGEYLSMMEEGGYIVLAVKIEEREKFSDGVMVSRMQKDTQMRIGKKSFALFTHFPPSSSDPYLRLVFKRPGTLTLADKSIFFAFLVPGASDPYRNVEFYLKDMQFKGKLEY